MSIAKKLGSWGSCARWGSTIHPLTLREAPNGSGALWRETILIFLAYKGACIAVRRRKPLARTRGLGTSHDEGERHYSWSPLQDRTKARRPDRGRTGYQLSASLTFPAKSVESSRKYCAQTLKEIYGDNLGTELRQDAQSADLLITPLRA
jgi:hypothetical protein